MSNQAKRLSGCPAERLAQCRGNVEVLGVMVSFGESLKEVSWTKGKMPAMGVELIDRANATRLQAEVSALQQRLNAADQSVDDLTAERDGLLAEVEESRKDASGWKAMNMVSMAGKDRLRAERDDLQSELTKAQELLNTPHTDDWFEGVRLEAGHQIGRWGADHDAGKAPADWFWLIGYLAQKAMTAQMAGSEEKARHHTISTGAAMLNWFRAIVGDSNVMRPGIDAHQSAPAAKGGSDE